MKIVSPLEDIYVTGMLGNYINKEKNEFITIKEQNNLNIFEIIHSNNDGVPGQEIIFDNLKLPVSCNQVSFNQLNRLIWLGPGKSLLISEDKDCDVKLRSIKDKEHFNLTDQSNSKIIIQISGDNVLNLLKKGSPLNFDKFAINSGASTTFFGIHLIFDIIEENPLAINLLAPRSFAHSFYEALTDAALEFGAKIK